MVAKTVRRKSVPKEEQIDLCEDMMDEEESRPVSAPVSAKPIGKVVHIESADIINALNNAVSSINSVFQQRDFLKNEVDALKSELSISKDIRVEQSRVEALKREQDNFDYEFGVRKKRLEDELSAKEDQTKEKLSVMEEEKRAELKVDADEQALRMKTEREEHIRKMKLEREDFERERKLFNTECAALSTREKVFEEDRIKMREKLVSELNLENDHASQIAGLNHQKEIELLRGELKLEQTTRAKFEALLAESKVQNEKLAEQLSTLSREALASASNASMASKLKDLIGHLPSQTPVGRG